MIRFRATSPNSCNPHETFREKEREREEAKERDCNSLKRGSSLKNLSRIIYFSYKRKTRDLKDDDVLPSESREKFVTRPPG